MSEKPHRPESEQSAIRQRAYERWESLGRKPEQDAEHWLEAEAALQAKGIITRRPLELPFLLSYRATGGIDDGSKTASFTVPLRLLSDPDGRLRMSAADVTSGSPRRIRLATTKTTFLPPEMLAHESRLVGLQMVRVLTALDRIARLADFVAEMDEFPPDRNLFERDPDITETMYRFKPGVREALFEPDRFRPDLIDNALSNYPYASGIALDVLQLSFGSDVEAVVKLMAMGWKKATVAISLILGLSFAVPIVTTAGFYEAGRWFPPPPAQTHPPPGVSGKIHPIPTVQQNDLWAAIQRDYNAENA